jgi:hypothetical protein
MGDGGFVSSDGDAAIVPEGGEKFHRFSSHATPKSLLHVIMFLERRRPVGRFPERSVRIFFMADILPDGRLLCLICRIRRKMIV